MLFFLMASRFADLKFEKKREKKNLKVVFTTKILI